MGSQRRVKFGGKGWGIKLKMYLGLNEDGIELEATDTGPVSVGNGEPWEV